MEEAAAISRLIGDDRNRTVGWVYLWNTSELSILWIGGRDVAEFIEPAVCPEMLAKARPTTPDDVVELLSALSIAAPETPD